MQALKQFYWPQTTTFNNLLFSVGLLYVFKTNFRAFFTLGLNC